MKNWIHFFQASFDASKNITTNDKNSSEYHFVILQTKWRDSTLFPNLFNNTGAWLIPDRSISLDLNIGQLVYWTGAAV